MVEAPNGVPLAKTKKIPYLCAVAISNNESLNPFQVVRFGRVFP